MNDRLSQKVRGELDNEAKQQVQINKIINQKKFAVLRAKTTNWNNFDNGVVWDNFRHATGKKRLVFKLLYTSPKVQNIFDEEIRT